MAGFGEQRTHDLTRTSSATAGGSECSKLTEFFHKSNVRIGTARVWLERLVSPLTNEVIVS